MKSAIAFIFLFGWFSIFGFSQIPELTQQKTMGGDSYDSGECMVEQCSGELVICATSFSGVSGNKTKEAFKEEDIWVYKLSRNREIVWQVSLGGDGFDSPSAIIETVEGGFLVLGSSSSGISGNKFASNYGNSDVWLVKLSNDGVIEWQKTYGGSENDVGKDIIPLDGGDFMILASSFSGASGTKTTPNKGGSDYWLIRVDANGNLIDEAVIGGQGSDYAEDCMLLGDDKLVITGISESGVSGDKTSPNYGGPDFWTVIVKLDGTVLYSVGEGGSGYDLARSISIRNDEVLIVGTSSSSASGSKTLPSYGFEDFWCIAYDDHLNRKWEQVFGGINSDGFHADVKGLFFESLGQYVIAGGSRSNVSGNKGVPNIGAVWGDFWVIGIDTLGVKQFEYMAGGDGDEIVNDIMLSNKNQLFVLGASLSGKTGNKEEENYGGPDSWLVELDFGIWEEPNYEEFTLTAFPIPASSVLRYSLPILPCEAEVVLTDYAGQMVYQNSIESRNDWQIDVTNIQKGIYILYVKTKDFYYTKKVMIDK